MRKSVLSGGTTFALLLFPLLSFTGCYATVEVGDSSAEKAIAIDWVEPPCAEPGSDAGYIEGNGFGAENVTITVDGIEAVVLAATGKDASFVVPLGLPPGPIDVVVMNPGGRLATIQWVVCGFDCSAIDCTSGNECIEDGTCDPATGTCIDGGNQPADTACGDGDVCDDQGNCVECNGAAQCTEDDNDCTAASCIDGACGQSDLLDGTMCDLLSAGDGVCMSGVCEAAPECTDHIDCDDGNDCTTDTCDSVVGTCAHAPVGNGATCDFDGLPGICAAGMCEEDLCADVDCDDGDPCTTDSCEPLNGTCSHVNTCGDTDFPVLTGFDFNPKSVDVSGGPVEITCVATATDTGTGVGLVQGWFRSPSGAQNFGCSNMPLTGGDPFDGTFTGGQPLAQGVEAGTWVLDHVNVQDDIGNLSVYDTADLQALGIPTQLDVVSQADTDFPVLTGFDFNPKSVDVSGGPVEITCVATATDTGTGVGLVQGWFRSPSGAQNFGCSNMPLTGGDPFDGTFTGGQPLAQGVEAGTWVLDHVNVQDDIGNLSVYDTADLQALGIPTQLDVVSQADTDFPVLTGFDFNPKGVDVSGGPVEITCVATATDTGTGVGLVQGWFRSPSGAQNFGCSNMPLTGGDPFDGTFTGGQPLAQGVEAGTWVLDHVNVQDDIGNLSVYDTADLQALGIPTQLDVTYGGGSPP